MPWLRRRMCQCPCCWCFLASCRLAQLSAPTTSPTREPTIYAAMSTLSADTAGTPARHPLFWLPRQSRRWLCAPMAWHPTALHMGLRWRQLRQVVLLRGTRGLHIDLLPPSHQSGRIDCRHLTRMEHLTGIQGLHKDCCAAILRHPPAVGNGLPLAYCRP